MNLSDKVYYVECNFMIFKYDVLETTVGKEIKRFQYDVDDVLKSFEKREDKSHFILNSARANGFLQNYNFYFDRNDAIKEMLRNLDEQISRKNDELNSLNDIRNKWIKEMS